MCELYIAWLKGASYSELAEDYDLSTSAIGHFIRGETWKGLARPDFPKERFERDILGIVRPAVAAMVASALMVPVMLSFGGLLSDGAILRAIWERRPWASRKRRRELIRALPSLRPEPPDPPSAPASASGVVTGPHALVAFPAPREIASQARPMLPTDRSRFDDDVYLKMHTKRFEVIIGGQSDGGERRQA
jgi:hypothetical protein